MKLLYKDYLLQQRSTAVFELLSLQVRSYLEALGFYLEYETRSPIEILAELDDALYCGEGSIATVKEIAEARFIMYDAKTQFCYWFANPYDAIMWCNAQVGIKRDCALMGYPQKDEWTAIFDRYRGHIHNGFYWLYVDDLDYIDDIISTPLRIYCESRRIEFLTVEDCAFWLVSIGKAADVSRATAQLKKHLEGKTSSCYGMVFKQY